jgi:hypothetical protein
MDLIITRRGKENEEQENVESSNGENQEGEEGQEEGKQEEEGEEEEGEPKNWDHPDDPSMEGITPKQYFQQLYEAVCILIK